MAAVDTRQDYLLDMIRRAGEALVALFVDVSPGERVQDDEQDLDRALDDVFAGLGSRAHQLDADTLRSVLRHGDRVLLFAILQARKGMQQLHLGDDDEARARLACARDLLAGLAEDPGDDAGALARADAARPLAAALADYLAAVA
jgi:hypothetical protein